MGVDNTNTSRSRENSFAYLLELLEQQHQILQQALLPVPTLDGVDSQRQFSYHDPQQDPQAKVVPCEIPNFANATMLAQNIASNMGRNLGASCATNAAHCPRDSQELTTDLVYPSTSKRRNKPCNAAAHKRIPKCCCCCCCCHRRRRRRKSAHNKQNKNCGHAAVFPSDEQRHLKPDREEIRTEPNSDNRPQHAIKFAESETQHRNRDRIAPTIRFSESSLRPRDFPADVSAGHVDEAQPQHNNPKNGPASTQQSRSGERRYRDNDTRGDHPDDDVDSNMRLITSERAAGSYLQGALNRGWTSHVRPVSPIKDMLQESILNLPGSVSTSGKSRAQGVGMHFAPRMYTPDESQPQNPASATSNRATNSLVSHGLSGRQSEVKNVDSAMAQKAISARYSGSGDGAAIAHATPRTRSPPRTPPVGQYQSASDTIRVHADTLSHTEQDNPIPSSNFPSTPADSSVTPQAAMISRRSRTNYRTTEPHTEQDHSVSARTTLYERSVQGDSAASATTLPSGQFLGGRVAAMIHPMASRGHTSVTTDGPWVVVRKKCSRVSSHATEKTSAGPTTVAWRAHEVAHAVDGSWEESSDARRHVPPQNPPRGGAVALHPTRSVRAPLQHTSPRVHGWGTPTQQMERFWMRGCSERYGVEDFRASVATLAATKYKMQLGAACRRAPHPLATPPFDHHPATHPFDYLSATATYDVPDDPQSRVTTSGSAHNRIDQTPTHELSTSISRPTQAGGTRTTPAFSYQAVPCEPPTTPASHLSDSRFVRQSIDTGNNSECASSAHAHRDDVDEHYHYNPHDVDASMHDAPHTTDDAEQFGTETRHLSRRSEHADATLIAPGLDALVDLDQCVDSAEAILRGHRERMQRKSAGMSTPVMRDAAVVGDVAVSP